MDSLVPDRDETGPGRRAIVVGALGAGFAAAALPRTRVDRDREPASCRVLEKSR